MAWTPEVIEEGGTWVAIGKEDECVTAALKELVLFERKEKRYLDLFTRITEFQKKKLLWDTSRTHFTVAVGWVNKLVPPARAIGASVAAAAGLPVIVATAPGKSKEPVNKSVYIPHIFGQQM